jgi:glycosyltransferase involved in cell wall biosynthesis
VTTHVAEVEIEGPLPEILLPDRADGAMVLARRNGRPVGLARLRASGRISPDRLARAIRDQVDAADPPASPAGAVPRVSIVVCTRDRPDSLRRCLQALRPLHATGHEVVVVDNAPRSDETARVCASYPYAYRLEPEPGLNRARNHGLRAATREVVAFTDDDCEPDPGWADALAATYADERVGGATGLVMPRELETRPQERFEAYCANRRRFRPRTYSSRDTPPSAAGVVGMGANMSFRRALLDELGGFDARFDGGMPTLSGGDTEAFARVLAHGRSIAYRPDALVWHTHRREEAALRRVVFGYGVGLYAVLAKRLLEDGDRGVWRTAPRWLLGPIVKAFWNAARRRPATPPDLLLAELAGALLGPLRYRAASRIVARSST